MRDGIKACPANWSNCSMWVQDLVSPCTNITAEISKQEVDNFLKMCRMFSTHVPKLNLSKSSGLPNTASSVNEINANANRNVDLIVSIEKEITNSLSPSYLEFRQRSELEITDLVK